MAIVVDYPEAVEVRLAKEWKLRASVVVDGGKVVVRSGGRVKSSNVVLQGKVCAKKR